MKYFDKFKNSRIYYKRLQKLAFFFKVLSVYEYFKGTNNIFSSYQDFLGWN